MGSAAKSVSRGISKVGKAVSSAGKGITGGISKIAQGKVSEGLGDIGQSAARTGLDTVTGGNKSLVDSLTGGLLTSAELAARGNSADITRVGVTAGAFATGGPLTALAVNQQLAAGANPLQVALTQGTGMDWLDQVGKVLNNPTVAGLTSNLFGSNKAPSAPKSTPAQIIAAPPQPAGISTNMLLIGGAVVLFLVGGLFLIFRGRK